MSDGKKVPIWVWVLAVVALSFLGLTIVLPIAVYGLRRYIENAKQSEARSVLTAWSEGVLRCAQREGHLPPSTKPVPASLAFVAAKKYQSSPSDWREQAHTCAGFSLSGPQYFQYQWLLNSPDRGSLVARADLNADGVADSSLQIDIVCSGGKCVSSGVPSAASEPAAASDATSSQVTATPTAAALAPMLSGAAVDLSTVMGRARKLANAWDGEAALLGVEATLVDGKIQTQNGATAKLTFGPSPFAAVQTRTGLFVVVYDKSGINGAATKGVVGKPLPEPRCAPEGVLPHVSDLAGSPFVLRYAFDASQRPMWIVTSLSEPKRVRLFDPQDCQVRGNVVPPRH